MVLDIEESLLSRIGIWLGSLFAASAASGNWRTWGLPSLEEAWSADVLEGPSQRVSKEASGQF